MLLYDLSRDPYEKRNLALEMPEKAEALNRALAEFLAEVGAHIPQVKEN